jgi:hypothetical protein
VLKLIYNARLLIWLQPSPSKLLIPILWIFFRSTFTGMQFRINWYRRNRPSALLFAEKSAKIRAQGKNEDSYMPHNAMAHTNRFLFKRGEESIVSSILLFPTSSSNLSVPNMTSERCAHPSLLLNHTNAYPCYEARRTSVLRGKGRPFLTAPPTSPRTTSSHMFSGRRQGTKPTLSLQERLTTRKTSHLSLWPVPSLAQFLVIITNCS